MKMNMELNKHIFDLETLKGQKGTAFIDAMIERGEVIGDELHVSSDLYRNLKKEFGKPPLILRGLGDAVHLVANPIAKVIDKTLGTSVESCGGCKSRREALNRLIPFARRSKNS